MWSERSNFVRSQKTFNEAQTFAVATQKQISPKQANFFFLKIKKPVIAGTFWSSQTIGVSSRCQLQNNPNSSFLPYYSSLMHESSLWQLNGNKLQIPQKSHPE